MNHVSDSHPTEARLMAYLDGELSREERANLSRHLSGCSRCTRVAEELRRSSAAFSEAVSALTPPPAETTTDDLLRRAGSDDAEVEVAARIGGGEDSDRFGWSTAARIAASVAVLLGVAAALPGSPVRSWIDRSVQGVQDFLGADDGRESSRAVDVRQAPPPDVADRSGVAVSADGGTVRVDLVEVPETTTIRVRVVDGGRAGVWNANGDYRTAPGRIVVASPDSDTLQVHVPRSLPRVRLIVNGRLVLSSHGGELDVRVPGERQRDGEVTFRPPGTQ